MNPFFAFFATTVAILAPLATANPADRVEICKGGITLLLPEKAAATQLDKGATLGPCPATECLPETLLCPDGTRVGRLNDNGCNFAPCSAQNGENVCKDLEPQLLECWEGTFATRDPRNDCDFVFCPSEPPSVTPSAAPSTAPSTAPSAAPSTAPSAAPTSSPTASPTAGPTGSPTGSPTARPSLRPTRTPTPVPTPEPTSGAVTADSNGCYTSTNSAAVTQACIDDGAGCCTASGCSWNSVWVVTVCPKSCAGEQACYFESTGFSKGSIKVGADSCVGTAACNRIGGRAAHDNGVTIGANSCRGVFACSNLVGNSVGDDSCNGDSACYGRD